MSDYMPVEGVEIVKTSDLRPGDIMIDDEYPSIAWLIIAVYPFADTFETATYKVIYTAFGTTQVRQTRAMHHDSWDILRVR